MVYQPFLRYASRESLYAPLITDQVGIETYSKRPANRWGKGASMERKEIHALALVCHSMMATLHGIGLLYNFRRKNWIESAIHASVLCFNIKSVNSHRKEMK